MTRKTAEFFGRVLATIRLQRKRLKYWLFDKKAGADLMMAIFHSPTLPGNGPLVVWVVFGVNHGGT